MMHGGDIFSAKVKHDFSVNVNPFYKLKLNWVHFMSFVKSMRIYPDIESSELRNVIAKKYGVKKINVLAGNGASELLFSATRAIMPKKAILISPCFSGYVHALNSVDAKIIYFPLDENDDFKITEEKFLELKKIIEHEKPEMIFICNPNNPNGKLCKKEIIIKIIMAAKNAGGIVLLDETFIELTGKQNDFSMIKNLYQHENLIILNALTKTYSVPGLRLGFCFSSSSNLIKKIKSQIPEWNVSSPAQKIGTLILNGRNNISNHVEKILKEKKFLENKLNQMGFKTYSSDVNFILFYSEKENELKNKLLEHKILIRDCSDYENLKKGFYRIAVKTHKENKILMQALMSSRKQENEKN